MQDHATYSILLSVSALEPYPANGVRAPSEDDVIVGGGGGGESAERLWLTARWNVTERFPSFLAGPKNGVIWPKIGIAGVKLLKKCPTTSAQLTLSNWTRASRLQ